jgi:hypothetical protein
MVRTFLIMYLADLLLLSFTCVDSCTFSNSIAHCASVPIKSKFKMSLVPQQLKTAKIKSLKINIDNLSRTAYIYVLAAIIDNSNYDIS